MLKIMKGLWIVKTRVHLVKVCIKTSDLVMQRESNINIYNVE